MTDTTEDLIRDLPIWERHMFLKELRRVQRGSFPLRYEVTALRIAGDPEIFPDQFPVEVTYPVVLALVERGHLTEDNIERYEEAS